MRLLGCYRGGRLITLRALAICRAIRDRPLKSQKLLGDVVGRNIICNG